jgi:hypothetical protein
VLRAARLENWSLINHSPPLELKVFASRKPGVTLTQVGQGSRWSVVPIMGSYRTERIKVHSHQFCDFDLLSAVRFHYLLHRKFLSLATEYIL